ncbi:MAG: hypothetical protein NWS71_11135 [Opitutales bacterium]|nr:hypothetical protein [Opitutales bacterium]
MNKNKIIELLQEAVFEDNLDVDRPLNSIPTWDSMAKMNFTATIEEEFGVFLEFGALDEVSSVADVVRAVEHKIESK